MKLFMTGFVILTLGLFGGAWHILFDTIFAAAPDSLNPQETFMNAWYAPVIAIAMIVLGIVIMALSVMRRRRQGV